MNYKSYFLSGLALTQLILGGVLQAALPDLSKMNILFLCPEDWSAAAIGVYGNQQVKTPNLDEFAKTGTLFTKAYCQNPVCNPSRSSFNTGLRSDTTRVFSNADKFQEVIPDWATTIGETLKSHPIKTYMIGKLFHHNWDAIVQSSAYDGMLKYGKQEGYKGRVIEYNIPKGTPPNPPKTWTYTSDLDWDAKMIEAMKVRKELWANAVKGSEQWEEGRSVFQTLSAELIGDSGDIEERNSDGVKARVVANLIRDHAESGEQFFITYGSSRPHTPLIAPMKYFDLYDPSTLELSKARKELDQDIPSVAKRHGRNWDIFKIRKETTKQAQAAIHAYYACASFIDDQIGLILEALEESGQADNTVVIFTSDHGFHLGEHGMWSKISLFEQATRVPMIVRIPGVTDGATCGEIVELVDLYPTLCDMLGLELPHEKLEGISFLPLVETPDLAWKKAAFTLCRQGKHLGRSIRTKSHRYTEWIDYADRDDDHAIVRFTELYHLDVDELEQVNLANRIEYAPKRRELAGLLSEGWESALPPVN